MPMKRTLLLVLTGGLAIAAASAEATSTPAPTPALPRSWVTRDVCPFECCTYRRWCARRAIPVRTSESRTGRVAFTIARGDSLAGDRLALLEYCGEGSTHAWLRGRECWIDVDLLSHAGPTMARRATRSTTRTPVVRCPGA